MEDAADTVFVGNSLIYFNDVPGLATWIATSGGKTMHARILATPGANAIDHVADARVLRALDEPSFGQLVLQEQGGALLCASRASRSGACDDLVRAERELAAMAKRRGASVTVLGTYQADADAQSALSRAEERAAREIGADRVIRLGYAQHHLMRRLPRFGWLGSDSVHPGPDASVLAAMLLHRATYGQWPSLEGVELTVCEHAMSPDHALAVRPDSCKLLSTQHLSRLEQGIRAVCGLDAAACVMSLTDR